MIPFFEGHGDSRYVYVPMVIGGLGKVAPAEPLVGGLPATTNMLNPEKGSASVSKWLHCQGYPLNRGSACNWAAKAFGLSWAAREVYGAWANAGER